jgi:hypothetical protein
VADINLKTLNAFGLKYLGFDLHRLLVDIGHPETIQNKAERVDEKKNQVGHQHKLMSDPRDEIMHEDGQQQEAAIKHQCVEEFVSNGAGKQEIGQCSSEVEAVFHS